jgi:hypothetical protein
MMKPTQHRTRYDFALNWLGCIRSGGDTQVDPLVRTVFIEIVDVLVHEAT